MKEERKYIRNYTTLTAFESGKNFNVRNDANGEEAGVELRGMLTTFDVVNENGFIFKVESFDEFVDDYFIKNSLNIPVVLLHNEEDITHLAGKVEKMTKTANGVEVEIFIPRCAYFYNLIKNMITAGVLQGFSSAGGVVEGHYDNNGAAFEIEKFALLNVALVATPADVGAKFVSNTIFEGFENGRRNEKPQPLEVWRTII